MKKLGSIILAIIMIFSVGALVACGGVTDPPGTKTAVFEAEGIDLSQASGHGSSNNANGCQMIQGTNIAAIRGKEKVLKSISNGYFVGYFGVQDIEFAFNFTSDADDASSTLILRLASEWGTLLVDQSVVKIEVNGANIDYTAFTVNAQKIDGVASVVYGEPFMDFTIDKKVALKKGDNVIKLISQGKGYGTNEAMDIGPGVDCIKIKSLSNLVFNSIWEDNKLNLKVEE